MKYIVRHKICDPYFSLSASLSLLSLQVFVVNTFDVEYIYGFV